MTEANKCCSEYLRMFLLDAIKRLPTDAQRLSRSLTSDGQQSLETLSVNARVMRSALQNHLPRLEALGLIDYDQVGASKRYYLTLLGQNLCEYLEGESDEE